MKKLLGKLALVLVPIAVYLCVFCAFDAYDYFGWQHSTDDNNPITRVQNFNAAPQNCIILGDSRVAHFDMAQAEEAFGAGINNLSFGGASLEESLDLFDYALEKNPQLNTVIFSLSFYTLNASYGSVSRMSTIETQLANPIAYISNLEYNVNMLTNLANKLTGAADDATAEETRTPAADDRTDIYGGGGALPYRRDLILYANSLYSNCAESGTLPAVQTDANGNATNTAALLQAMQSATPAESKWRVNEKQLARLLKTAAACKEKGIRFVVVFPPMDESVRALVCDPLGITAGMQPVLAQLQSAGVEVLDYEWTDRLGLTDDAFYDGFHLDTRRGLGVFTQSLFSEVA